MTKKLTKNRRYRRLLQAVEEGLYAFPFEDTLAEIQDLHKQLEIRRLTAKSLRRGQQKKLLEANLQNQSYRSRIIELLVQSRQFHANLEREYKLTRDYLLQRYPDQFAEYRTKEERMRSLDTLFEPVVDLLGQYTNLHATAELIIDDLDKASWSIKSTLDILNLGGKKEYYH